MMNRNRAEKLKLEIVAEVADMLRDEMRQPQPIPPVTNWWSGLVALFRSSGVDGRLGIGDILVSVSLAGAAVFIGLLGSGVQWAVGIPWAQSRFFFEVCSTIGCIMGTARLGLDALLAPLGQGLSHGLDWLHDTGIDWIEAWRGSVECKPEPRTMRQISYTNQGGTEGMSIDVGPAQVWTLEIPSKNLKSGWRKIAWEDVRTFIHAATATGNWTRDSQTVLDQKTHADLKRYLEDTNEGRKENWPILMWGFGPLARPIALELLRNKLTNGNERTGTNEGTTT